MINLISPEKTILADYSGYLWAFLKWLKTKDGQKILAEGKK